MIWPPVKAWTSNKYIQGQRHFVAINYGGKLSERWVILISVVDSSVLLKVPWSKLIDSSVWNSGWNLLDSSKTSHRFDKNSDLSLDICSAPSIDSGLTIPITKKPIRAWFE